MPPSGSQRPIRTLIADDSETFVASVVRWAQDQPELEVIATERNGLDVIHAIKRHRPDLVIVEATLPGLDGFQVVKALKEMPGAPLAVIVTFPASPEARMEALAAGADGFVAKEEFTASFELLLEGLPEAGEE